jgi:hypothetical protein
MLVAAPPLLRLALLLALAAHASARRPRPMPAAIVIGADGTCLIPDWGTADLPLGPRTLVCAWWVRLELGTGLRRRELLLFADQLSVADWARLRARLQRTRCG